MGRQPCYSTVTPVASSGEKPDDVIWRDQCRRAWGVGDAAAGLGRRGCEQLEDVRLELSGLQTHCVTVRFEISRREEHMRPLV
jgi:hypothetical protein